MKSYALLAAGALALLGAAGCSRSGSKTEAAAVPEEKRYPLTGEVVSVDAARKVLVVQHDEIKGLMPAMTMEFAVSGSDAAAAKPGQRIRAELIPRDKGAWRLEKIWPDEKSAAAAIAAQAAALRQDTLIRGNGAYREVGEKIPDFALYDQEGRVVQSVRFHGKQIMLNFIFSRCPVATMCPASTLKMMAVQKLAREAGVKNLELVSITLDPAYDSPAVLKDYAATRGIDTANFSFLTGPDSAIKDLLTQFGIIAEFDGNLLKHTLSTLLVDENGRIIQRADGSAWEDDCAADFAPESRARQPFLPDGSRSFEEIDRLGVGEHGVGNLIAARAEVDFYRLLPPSGYTKGLPADQRTDTPFPGEEGDIPPERRGRNFFPYKPVHLGASPARSTLARVVNLTQRVLSGGEYDGAILTQGSPRVEETIYWLNLLLDVTVPVCGNAAQGSRRAGRCCSTSRRPGIAGIPSSASRCCRLRCAAWAG